jgi:hypothetical protein
MLSYILILMSLFCNGSNHCIETRSEEFYETAQAIETVATNNNEARWLVVVAFAETGFRTQSYWRHGRLVHITPFGAQAYATRHPGASLNDLAAAALRSVYYGGMCGREFSNRMHMFIAGQCTTGIQRILQESLRRQRMYRRLLTY